MPSKNSWFWIAAALVLFGLVLVHQRFGKTPSAGPVKVLSQLRPVTVTNIQVQLKGQREIRAVRSTGDWELTEPIAGPAQSASINNLLAALDRLAPTVLIPERDRRHRPRADEEDGLDSPQAVIVVQQSDYQVRLRVGARTPPGDEVFLQVIGVEGVYVVDAELLKAIPKSASDWRDTTFLNTDGLVFDRVAITNGARAIEFTRAGTNAGWRITQPPIMARADPARIDELLEKLRSLRILQFISDARNPDLESFGLQPPELSIALGRGTNQVALLQFGKSPTNEASQVFGRNLGQASIVTVSKDLLSTWREGGVNDFRDPYLVDLSNNVDVVEVIGPETFSISRQTNQTWRAANCSFPVETALAIEAINRLSKMPIAEFTRDAVTPADLPAYGLATPLRRYVLKGGMGSEPGATNSVLAELQFGTNQNGRVYVKRADESSIYAVNEKDFIALPVAPFQFRDRKIWSVPEEEVTRVTIRQGAKTRQLDHRGPHVWSLAPGSQGILMNELALSETIRMITKLDAPGWLGEGETGRQRLGYGETNHQVTLEMKNGEKYTLSFGALTTTGSALASVNLDGEPWFFEFPPALYAYVAAYLTIPASVP